MGKRALCIGINRYPGHELNGCVNDATDFANVLHDRGFTTSTLLDEKATSDTIRMAISENLGKTQYRDSLVITFSGHGTWVPDQDGDEPDHRDEALCPYDLPNLILDDYLHDVFVSIKLGARVLLIADSCHSGTVTKLAEPLALTNFTRQVRYLPPEEILPDTELPTAIKAAQTPARGRPRASALLFAGCADNEYCYDAQFGGKANGAFSFVALSVLRQLPQDTPVYEWYRQVRHKLPSVDFPQTPQLFGTYPQKRNFVV